MEKLKLYNRLLIIIGFIQMIFAWIPFYHHHVVSDYIKKFDVRFCPILSVVVFLLIFFIVQQQKSWINIMVIVLQVMRIILVYPIYFATTFEGVGGEIIGVTREDYMSYPILILDIFLWIFVMILLLIRSYSNT